MRQEQTIWPSGTDPLQALAAYRLARDEAEAAAIARSLLLQAAVVVATEANWSVAQVASYLGLSRAHVARFARKNGLVAYPRTPTADNHARVDAAIRSAVHASR